MRHTRQGSYNAGSNGDVCLYSTVPKETLDGMDHPRRSKRRPSHPVGSRRKTVLNPYGSNSIFGILFRGGVKETVRRS
jgi:hypothetical protein